MPISKSFKWRRSVTHRTLAFNISSLLLHHNKPLSHLRSKLSLLPLPFPSPLIRRIITSTRFNPDISLRFFLFASSHLSFSPTLPDHATIFSILASAGHLLPAAHLFYHALRCHPTPIVLDSLIRSSSSCKISLSKVLCFVLELYSKLPSWNAMETFIRMRDFGLVPGSRSLNSLLNMLCSNGENRTAWQVCAAALRIGAEMDRGSWPIMVRLLCQEGSIHRAEMLLNLGFSRRISSYDLVVDCYASRRDFRAAIQVLNGMEEKGLRLRLSTLSSVLEKSCKFCNFKISGIFMKEMVVRDLLPMAPTIDFDRMIWSFCELGKTSAAVLIFEKARSCNFDLTSTSYTCLLSALSQNGREKDAMKVFDIMSQRGIVVDPLSLDAFVSGICSGEPMEEIDAVIKSLMKNGSLPKASDLSTYVAKNCSRGRWKVATELLHLALDKCILVDGSCCCLLMKHFCKNGFLDLAIGLHEKIKGLGGFLDVDSYNVLLEALVVHGRAMEAIGVFDCMRKNNLLSSFSFVMMISALCHEKELRKAMNLHDEMLKLGLKPDIPTYKQLITGFQ
ncbi:pentatricopeptide repeat-containing protein At4g21170 [Phalaenopsis equestris]|uniref:pentatricopeptide repeat-containing protein At4g21170 n=1 Tax=Phalaenopsis equestris TaxID=78828 RepID=UPI0009E4FA1B|nr:pentatricopeptide repeat-containing protein At4g21170 [Phalaenopsis equestris]